MNIYSIFLLPERVYVDTIVFRDLRVTISYKGIVFNRDRMIKEYQRAKSLWEQRKTVRINYLRTLHSLCQNTVLQIVLFTNAHLLTDETLASIGEIYDANSSNQYLKMIHETRSIEIS